MLGVAALIAVSVCVLCGCATQSAARSQHRRSALSVTEVAQPVPAAGTFVSLVPAWACARHTELDEFSMASGRKLRRLAGVSIPSSERLDTPAATGDGRLFFTLTREVLCAARGFYAECPKFEPDSCRNAVMTLAPGRSSLRAAFTIPGSRSIGQAVPDPAGGRVALTTAPCFATHGTAGLFVRTLATGAMRAIATSHNVCDSFIPVAWNPAGSQLAFVHGRAGGPPETMVGGIACPQGRQYIAIAGADAPAAPNHLKQIAPQRGCVFGAVAFDATGLLAVEGCNQGDPSKNDGNAHLGQAYLVQYTSAGHLTRRFALRLGLEHAVLANVPHSPDLLVTLDQPANEPYPERDWVWEFDGSHLRLIAHYKADDAAQVLAVPW
ncbi:MAG TPA: hypothetical protein VHV28_11455 [Solirubrobacteraceae bacterium]|nr:hypothetical protein [Solirubrobacteraceae bacterium]